MATQLKDLKFNDYGFESEANSRGGVTFTMGSKDCIYYKTGSNNFPVIEYGSDWGPATWCFHGMAQNSANAKKASQLVTSNGSTVPISYDSSGSGAFVFDGKAAYAGSADNADHAANASEATSAGVAGSAYALMTEHGSVAPISMSGGCGESTWSFGGNAYTATHAENASSVGSSGGSVLYYSGGWILNAVAGSANSVYDSNGGSALYYDGGWVLNVPVSSFNDSNGGVYDFGYAVSLPELSKSGGGSNATLEDVESWIEQFRSSVTGYLVTATI